MKPASSQTVDLQLYFEVETIEQWLEDNLYANRNISAISDQYKIVCLTRSNAEITDGKINEITYVFCLSNSSSIQITANAKGYIISFTKDFLNIGESEFDLFHQLDLLQTVSQATGIILNNNFAIEIKEVVSKMLNEYANLYLFKTEMLKRYLKIFLIYLTRQFEEDVQQVLQTNNVRLVQKFKQAVEKNFRDKKMVSEYAEMLFVSANYLNEIIKRVTGYPAGFHIRQRVALEAKRMALQSDNSMKEIAYDLGFLDCAHFSKFFKTTTGSNFTEFKKEKLTIG